MPTSVPSPTPPPKTEPPPKKLSEEKLKLGLIGLARYFNQIRRNNPGSTERTH